jgi:hypothetical protein
VLVRAPLSELRKVVDDLLGLGMEDVWPVLVHKHAVLVVVVVGIARDVISAVDDEDSLPVLGGQALSHDRAGIAGSNNEGAVVLAHARRG